MHSAPDASTNWIDAFWASTTGALADFSDAPTDEEPNVSDYLERYTPAEALVPAATWSQIRRFVVDAVNETSPQSVYSAKNLIGPTAQFTAWLFLKGYDLDRDEIFTRSNVEVWVASQISHLSDGARGNYRTYLRSVCQAVGEHTTVAFRPRGLHGAASTAPYTPQEVVALKHWARHQPTGNLRDGATILTAAAFGAGLSTEDLALVRGTDVITTGNGTHITVPGRRPRIVVVLKDWEAWINAAAQFAGDGHLFLPGRPNRGRNLTTNFVKQCHRSDAPHMSTQRARVTWIVGHLNRGVPLRPFLTAAGIATISGLERYLKFLDPSDEVAASRMRGAVR